MGEAARKLEYSDNGEGSRLLEMIKEQQIAVEFSLDGKIHFSSQKFLEALDLEEGELSDFKSLFNPEYNESSDYVELWKALALGHSYSGEFSFLSKKGVSVWLAANFAPIYNSEGNVEKVVLIGSDVTASKSELEVRTNIMNLTSIVSESDLKGNILSINEKYIETSKYEREELIGQPHSITRHPDMPKAVFKEMWGTIGRKKMFRGKIKNLAKDGNPYYVDAVISPLIGKNGRPYKYLGVRYDITEDEVEKQVMKGILGAIHAGFAFVEFDTKGHFLNGNENFFKTLGYSFEELEGLHHSLFCDPEYVKTDDYRKLWEDLANGKGRTGIYKRQNKAGEVLWLQGIYEPVKDETGRVLKVVKLVTNVTDQQNMLAAIKETALELAHASTELTSTAQVMAEASQKTSSESQSASTIADEVSNGVSIVATNIEEMVASIKEISRSTSESSQMAKATLEKAQESNSTVTKLGVSSKEIGDVIKVISSIAQQTNLLALNATIEAARAGEAGKGFAVVANEVKELAKQTAKATEDITQKIGAIQDDTKSAVEAIADISESVENLSSISGVIAASVEEQTATTNEISRVVVESKKGVESITESIGNVSEAATESSASASQTLGASEKLSLLADQLTALSSKDS